MIPRLTLGRVFSEMQQAKTTHYFITGSETHTVHVDFPASAKLKASPASLVYMSEGVEMTTSLFGGLKQGLGRLLSGASMMLVEFGYRGEGMGHVVLGPNFYSKLIPVDLKEFGGTMVCAKDSFVLGPEDTQVDVHVIRSFLSLIGGEGILLQRITGSSTVLLKASGAIQTLTLSPGESYYLHPGALVAYEDSSVSYEVQTVPGAKNIFFGQGMFLVKVTGPGKIIVQSMSETKFAQSLHIAGGSSLLNTLMLADLAMGDHGPATGEVGQSIDETAPGEAAAGESLSGDQEGKTDLGEGREAEGESQEGESGATEDNSKLGGDEESGSSELPGGDGDGGEGVIETVFGWIKDFF